MILRYPGGKKKSAPQLVALLCTGDPILELREPYCGSAAVSLTVLKDPNFKGQIWLNDKDPGIAALWTSVIQFPDALQARVLGFTPTVESFREFKGSLLAGGSQELVEQGFRKLAVHQMSFSGLGTRAGSPIGGWEQTSKYPVGCRWNAAGISKNIQLLHQSLRGRCIGNCCTQLDALEVITAPGDPEQVALYVDPPYVQEGGALYQVTYTDSKEHEHLAEALIKSSYRWLLSYDDAPLVRRLYQHLTILEKGWAYTINSKEGNAGKELIILKGIQAPLDPDPPVEDRQSFQALFGF